MERIAAEDTAEPIHHRPVAAIAGQSSDHAGEGGERISATIVFRAVGYLPRDHCRAERSLSARLLVGSMLGSSRNRSRLPRSSCQPSSFCSL